MHSATAPRLPENRHRWFTTAAALRRARGDLPGAVTLLRTAEELYLPGYFPDVRPLPAIRARLHLAQGRLDDAQSWATRRGVHAEDPVTFLTEYDLLTLARLLTATGSPGTAADIAGRVLDQAHAADRGGSIIEAILVRALAHDAAGETAAALDDLAAAVTRGVPVGYSRLYLDEAPALRRLLARLAATASQAAPLAQRLLDVDLDADGNEDSAASDASERVQPSGVDAPLERLSERELDVLRLLDSELSGPEIARRLFVSINTFRTHTKHIFTKLDVQTRRAAVRRATDLDLL